MAQPAFTREELVLLLDFYLDHRNAMPIAIGELSQHIDRGDPAVFRDPDGVMRAVRRFDVYANGRTDRDTPAYREVWDEYAHDRAALRDAARAVLDGHQRPVPGSPLIRRWWDADAAERFWLEASHRSDLGADLHAPIACCRP
jgi:hypothetical protein